MYTCGLTASCATRRHRTVRDERTRLWTRRSEPLKLGAADAWKRKQRWKQPQQRRSGSEPPDDPGPASKTERCNFGEPVMEPPLSARRLKPGRYGSVRSARSTPRGCGTTPPRRNSRQLGGSREELRRTWIDAAGEKLGTNPVQRFVVNVGTKPRPPWLPMPGTARCQLMASVRGGASVVVGDRESRLHGEGRQQARRFGTGMSGGRR